MSKTLIMNFLTAEGKKTSIRFKDVKEAVTPAEVSTVMDTIVEKNIFITANGELKVKDSAQIVDTTTEELAI